MRRIALAFAAVLVSSATLVLAAATSFQTVAQQASVQEGPLLATTPQVVSLLAEAEKLRLALRFEEAHARVDEAATVAARVGDRVGVALALKAKGTLFNWSGNSVEAEPWFLRARAEFESLGSRRGVASAVMGLTNALAAQGLWDRARGAGTEAIKIYTELGEEASRLYVQLNLIRSDSRDVNDRKVLEDVVAAAESLQNEGLLFNALSKLGALQFSSGDYVAAQVNVEKVVAWEHRKGDISGEAAQRIMLGRIRRAHNDWDGALREYQQAVDMLAPTNERFMLVQAINATSIALNRLGRRADAMAAIERGLALARDSRNETLVDFMLGNLGGQLVSDGEMARAVPVLQEVLSRKPSPYIASYRHEQLADALNQLGRTAEALDHATSSVRLTRQVGLIDELGARLARRASILGKLDRLDEAVTDAREMVAVLDGQRQKLLPSDFFKRGFAGRVEKSYALIVDLLMKQGRTTEAFEASEQGRARAFLDLLAAREESTATIATRGPETPAPASGALVSHSLAKPIGAKDIDAIAARLGTTIVTFWVNDDATSVWIVGPDGRRSSATLAVARGRLTELVVSTTALLRPAASKAAPTASASEAAKSPPAAAALPLRGLGLLALSRDDRSAWRALYKILIEPIRAQLPRRGSRLTIVPHGPLFQLAFAALQGGDGRYLVEDFDLHYAPAASTLDFTSRRQELVRAGAQGPWALVGNPSSLPEIDGRPLAPLPGAARELSAIAAIAPQRRVIALDAAGADEGRLGRALESSRPSVLHFATHGFVFDDPKTSPFLVMNRRSEAAGEDGRLTLDEVYELRLTSDLVVLSACRSGTGPVSSDGILGLTRGFFYAGTPSVLATHWDVPDVTTAILMPEFYRRYVSAREKSRSLRGAQLALIADLRAGKVIVTASGRRVTLPEHPLLWAAFFLSGEP